VFIIAGARPNFVKVAPLVREMRTRPHIETLLVHTGQHYDDDMSDSFFRDLDIGAPDFHLGAGSGSHGVQTARILVAFEDLCVRQRPDLVVVSGDINSTIACALAATKLGIPVAHVEAGLRSFDRTMPEEINRLAVDAISDLFFTTEPSGTENLLREGKAPSSVHFVGNLMIDNLRHQVAQLPRRPEKPAEKFIVMTLHRPSNVDVPGKLAGLLGAASEIARDIPVFFPVHPRTSARIEEFALGHLFHDGFHRLAPLGYQAFLGLWRDASLVMTDSGGLQEETTALGVPCFTIRENTERPITVDEGTNILVGNDPARLLKMFSEFRAGSIKAGRIPALWDGKTAKRVVDVIDRFLAAPPGSSL
jgi:UDP-N-acetylglucosamine 2-epimerase (non-hydrolysing)